MVRLPRDEQPDFLLAQLPEPGDCAEGKRSCGVELMSNATQPVAAPFQRTGAMEHLRRKFFRTPFRRGCRPGCCLSVALFVGWKLIGLGRLERGLDHCRMEPRRPAGHADGACWAVIARPLAADHVRRLSVRGTMARRIGHSRARLSRHPVLRAGLLDRGAAGGSVAVGIRAVPVLMRWRHRSASLRRGRKWGGLALTLFFFAAMAIVGMPLSVFLALMRRSELPVVRASAVVLIDGVRSLPLVTILFTAALILPFVLPDGCRETRSGVSSRVSRFSSQPIRPRSCAPASRRSRAGRRRPRRRWA